MSEEKTRDEETYERNRHPLDLFCLDKTPPSSLLPHPVSKSPTTSCLINCPESQTKLKNGGGQPEKERETEDENKE